MLKITKNILLTSKNKVKLADFGLSKKLKIETEKCKNTCGTKLYLAPEIHAIEEKQTNYYYMNCDVFSLGCVLYEMTNKEPPFRFINHAQILHLKKNKIFKPINSNYSKYLQDLIKLMFNDRKSRPSIKEIMDIDFVYTHYNAFLQKVYYNYIIKFLYFLKLFY